MSSSSLPDNRRSTGLQGYDKMAVFLGSHPRMMMFRIFSELAAKCAIYYQAKISHLEKDLEAASRLDRESDDPEKRNYQYCWYDMNRARKDEDFQIQKVNEVRETLKEYYEYLILLTKIYKLASPGSADVNYLRGWKENPEEGNNFLKNRYAEGDAWDKPDLVSICVNEAIKDKRMDALTKWIHDVLPWFHQHLGCRFKLMRRQKLSPADLEKGRGEAWQYDSDSIAQVISMTSTMLAALWPIAAMFVLNLIPGPTVRLIITAIFTLLFALTVNIIASPKRVHLFAATTAYAAVLVTNSRAGH